MKNIVSKIGIISLLGLLPSASYAITNAMDLLYFTASAGVTMLNSTRDNLSHAKFSRKAVPAIRVGTGYFLTDEFGFGIECGTLILPNRTANGTANNITTKISDKPSIITCLVTVNTIIPTNALPLQVQIRGGVGASYLGNKISVTKKTNNIAVVNKYNLKKHIDLAYALGVYVSYEINQQTNIGMGAGWEYYGKTKKTKRPMNGISPIVYKGLTTDVRIIFAI